MFQRMWMFISPAVWAATFATYAILFFVVGVRQLSPPHAVMLCLLGTMSLGMLVASLTKWCARWRR